MAKALQEQSLRIAEVPTSPHWTEADYANYWKGLGKERVDYKYGDEFLLPYGKPIEIIRQTATELADLANAVWDETWKMVEEQGGLTPYLDKYAPHFAGTKLSNPQINAQFETMFRDGWMPPHANDVMLVEENGQPVWRIIESQTAIAYMAWFDVIAKAAGLNPDTDIWYQDNPYKVLNTIRNTARKETGNPNAHVTVIDTNPFGATYADQRGMAKALGTEKSLPIPMKDIYKGTDGHFYYQEYAVDGNGEPIKDGTDYKKTGNEVRITHAVLRMTQQDLDALYEQVKGDPAKVETLKEFLMEGNQDNVNFVWHSAMQQVIQKNTLADLRARFVAKGSPYAQYFVPIYNHGERVTQPGTYRLKPMDGNSGAGQSELVIAESDNFAVPEGFVVQQQFTPYPVWIEVPERIADAFPSRPELPVPPTEENVHLAPATIELRTMTVPGGRNRRGRKVDPRLFMARVAPRYMDPLHSPEITMTNVGKIRDAQQTTRPLDLDEQRLSPFGMAPVVIKREEAA